LVEPSSRLIIDLGICDEDDLRDFWREWVVHLDTRFNDLFVQASEMLGIGRLLVTKSLNEWALDGLNERARKGGPGSDPAEHFGELSARSSIGKNANGLSPKKPALLDRDLDSEVSYPEAIGWNAWKVKEVSWASAIGE